MYVSCLCFVSQMLRGKNSINDVALWNFHLRKKHPIRSGKKDTKGKNDSNNSNDNNNNDNNDNASKNSRPKSKKGTKRKQAETDKAIFTSPLSICPGGPNLKSDAWYECRNVAETLNGPVICTPFKKYHPLIPEVVGNNEYKQFTFAKLAKDGKSRMINTTIFAWDGLQQQRIQADIRQNVKACNSCVKELVKIHEFWPKMYLSNMGSNRWDQAISVNSRTMASFRRRSEKKYPLASPYIHSYRAFRLYNIWGKALAEFKELNPHLAIKHAPRPNLKKLQKNKIKIEYRSQLGAITSKTGVWFLDEEVREEDDRDLREWKLCGPYKFSMIDIFVYFMFVLHVYIYISFMCDVCVMFMFCLCYVYVM